MYNCARKPMKRPKRSLTHGHPKNENKKTKEKATIPVPPQKPHPTGISLYCICYYTQTDPQKYIT